MNTKLSEYPTRYISVGHRDILCQILNWTDGPPPKYLICNPLDDQYREEFLAVQKLGAWMKIKLHECELFKQESSESMNEYKLQRMMRDVRYWRDQDPEFVERIREGFHTLYGNS
jgi:hypothetical protein